MTKTFGDAIPQAFIDPVTYELMREPVMMPDGYTYEKSYIERVLSRKQNSPMTRQEMKFDQAIPNRNLKQVIDDYVAQSTQIKVTVVGSQDEKVWPVKVRLETSIRESCAGFRPKIKRCALGQRRYRTTWRSINARSGKPIASALRDRKYKCSSGYSMVPTSRRISIPTTPSRTLRNAWTTRPASQLTSKD
jgi:hypothetical protein